MKQIELRIYGDVHGVGFRFFVRQKAKLLGIMGFVKNEKDCVVVAAQGRDSSLSAFVNACKRGPILARVERVEEKEVPSESFEGFEIRI
jgi:acylphosphatase